MPAVTAQYPVQTGTAVLDFSTSDAWNIIDSATSTGGNSYSDLVDSNNNVVSGVTFIRTAPLTTIRQWNYSGHGSEHHQSNEELPLDEQWQCKR